MAQELPENIVQAIAISNAKSIGEQPAILANLALAQQIFNQNMQQQLQLAKQQAMNQIAVATAATTVGGTATNDDAMDRMEQMLSEGMDIPSDDQAAT